MKAISTTFKGPTDTRGARIIAREPDGKRLTLPYPHELNSEAAHRAAAEALRDRLEWKGELVAGWTRHGYVFVFGELATDYELERRGSGDVGSEEATE